MRQKTQPNTAHVYGLIDPATHIVRYVGQTGATTERYAEHCRGAVKATRAWIGGLTSRPVLVVLETVNGAGNDVPRLACECETKWIKRFRNTVMNQRMRDNCPTVWDRLVNR